MPGHRKGDLLSGLKQVHRDLGRASYTLHDVAKVNDIQAVVSARIKPAEKLPMELYKSLTWDRGKELADHGRFTLATKIHVYFYDLQKPVAARVE